jgi:hypothetical protein
MDSWVTVPSSAKAAAHPHVFEAVQVAERPNGWESGDPGCLVRARVIDNRGPVVADAPSTVVTAVPTARAAGVWHDLVFRPSISTVHAAQ